MIKGWYQNSKNSIVDKQKKKAKSMKGQLTGENVQMADKHQKCCSASQSMKEIQIKTTGKYH